MGVRFDVGILCWSFVYGVYTKYGIPMSKRRHSHRLVSGSLDKRIFALTPFVSKEEPEAKVFLLQERLALLCLVGKFNLKGKYTVHTPSSSGLSSNAEMVVDLVREPTPVLENSKL
jgi:hypothetical protein